MLPVPRKPNQTTVITPPPATHPHHPNPKPAAPIPPINWLWVLRDVMILTVATYIGGKSVGFSAKALNNPALMEAQSEAYILFMTLGFFVMAYLVRKNRVRHFSIVAVLLWVFGVLPNAIFFNAPLAVLLVNWLTSAPLIMFAMMVGGASGSALFKPKTK